MGVFQLVPRGRAATDREVVEQALRGSKLDRRDLRLAHTALNAYM